MSASINARIQVNTIDQSRSVVPDVNNIGATVIRASKGGVVPIRIPKGREDLITKIYGYPSSSYPDIWNLIEANKSSSIWVSAPSASDARYSGVKVSKLGLTTLGAVTSYASITFASADDYFAILSKNPEASDKRVTITKDDDDVFTIVGEYYDTIEKEWLEVESSPYTVSLDENKKDGYGKNIYIENIFEDDYYFGVVVNPTASISTFVTGTDVAFASGTRGTAITITELETGWNYFRSVNTYRADIFVDFTAVSGVETLFSTLRNTYQKYSAYLVPLANDTVANTVSDNVPATINNRGIYCYWNWAYVRNTYTNSKILLIPMGRVFQKHAAMVDVYNGLAPSYIDENGHGGQLGSGIIEMVYDPSEADLQDLWGIRVNPIVYDYNYGFIIAGQYTTTTIESDYTYIGHSRLADYMIYNIVKQALPFQITKLNDSFHRQQVKTITELIINPLLQAPYNLLRESLIICDETNNDDEALARGEFILTVKVKFTPFSEWIKLYFINVGQTTTITES